MLTKKGVQRNKGMKKCLQQRKRTYKPGSVSAVKTADDDHLSRLVIADKLKQVTHGLFVG